MPELCSHVVSWTSPSECAWWLGVCVSRAEWLAGMIGLHHEHHSLKFYGDRGDEGRSWLQVWLSNCTAVQQLLSSPWQAQKSVCLECSGLHSKPVSVHSAAVKFCPRRMQACYCTTKRSARVNKACTLNRHDKLALPLS